MIRQRRNPWAVKPPDEKGHCWKKTVMAFPGETAKTYTVGVCQRCGITSAQSWRDNNWTRPRCDDLIVKGVLET